MKFLLSLSFFGLFTIAASELEDEDGLEVAGAITIAGKEVREKRALGRIYTGSACEYIKLADITSNDGCVDGTKFVLKKEDTVRKQLLIMSGTPILAFVTKGEKFVNCTSYTEVTIQVDCKTVDGLSDVDLSATASPGDDYKYLGGLSYSWDSSNSPFCAGTLVSARWIVTSASCSYADSSVVSPSTVNVMMGSAPVPVDKVIVHNRYSQSGEENNIALWRLAQGSKESPVCLPAQGSQQTGTARLVGWRINPVAGYLNEELGERQVSLVQDCGQSGRICSTSATTDCGGDYGGPLIQGSNTLIGAAVSDSGCDDAGGKGLFTQISEHTEWVKTTIAANGGGDVCTSR